MRRLWSRFRLEDGNASDNGASRATDTSDDVESASTPSSKHAARPSLRTTLWAAYRVVRGGGQPALLRRKEHHRLRKIAERQVLDEVETNPNLFRKVDCPACAGSQTSDAFHNPVGFSFARCAHDGTVYMNPVPTLDTLSRLYNDPSYTMHWSVGHSADPADYERVARAIDAAPGQTLLDVGCSTGEFLKLAQERFECHGVEINAATAELARQAGFDVVTGTVDNVPGCERFDVVTMLQLIEHLAEPSVPLAGIRRVLKPDGLLYLDTPCVDSASFALFRERHMHVSGFGHVSLFTKRGLECLAERTGFTMVDHGYCGGIDMALHDLIGHKFAPRRFRHRVAFYSPRFLNACSLVDQFTFGKLAAALRPPGNQSYQWAVWRKD